MKRVSFQVAQTVFHQILIRLGEFGLSFYGQRQKNSWQEASDIKNIPSYILRMLAPLPHLVVSC